METSTSLSCKLSSHADAMLMGFSAHADTNFQVEDLLVSPTEEEEDGYDGDAALGSPLRPHATSNLFLCPPLSAGSIQLDLGGTATALHDAEEPSHGLCVPPDELAHQLEWLSSFNEDNFFAGGDAKLLSAMSGSLRSSSALTPCIKDAHAPATPQSARDEFHSQSPVSVLEHGGHAYTLNHHAQRASRVRKARTGGRVWSLDILKPILLENRLKASYENTSLFVTSCSSIYSEPLCSFLHPDDSERPYKKIKQVGADVDAAIDSVFVRKCTHCLVQKTPQWRAGPLGPKTLCNACGVRYKSGRLLPEYRPAASPSFVYEVHSNSHRRILEMRRAKEVESHVKRYKRSKVEGAYMIKRESPVLQGNCEEHAPCKETPAESKESLSCEENSAHKDAEGSRGNAFFGDGSSGEESLIDGGISVCEGDIALFNEVHSHEECESPGNPSACKEKRLQENAHACDDINAVCKGESLCRGVATVDMVEQETCSGILQMDKCEGCKLEGRERNEENVDSL